jgi:hypothetical protein
MHHRVRWLVLAAVVAAATTLIFSRPPIPQPISYHDFADQRAFLGVPNFLNVLSNLPFLFVGVWGLLVVVRRKSNSAFLTGSERWAYAVFFLGVALTFLGPAITTWIPATRRWYGTSLPMPLGFMGILAATITERISVRAGVLSLPLLVVAGGLTVVYWSWTEAYGRGDLRPYLLIQFGSLLAVVVMLILFPARYTQTWCVVVALALYVAAKMLESFDPEFYGLGHIASGHTLKHLVAAGATYVILLMLQRRAAVLRSSD